MLKLLSCCFLFPVQQMPSLALYSHTRQNFRPREGRLLAPTSHHQIDCAEFICVRATAQKACTRLCYEQKHGPTAVLHPSASTHSHASKILLACWTARKLCVTRAREVATSVATSLAAGERRVVQRSKSFDGHSTQLCATLATSHSTVRDAIHVVGNLGKGSVLIAHSRSVVVASQRKVP